MTLKRTAALSLAAAGASLLGGCLYIRAEGDFVDAHHTARPMVYGAAVTAGDEVRLTVASNGCTQKSDFDVDVDRDDGRYEVHVHRKGRDDCRAFLPEGVELTWSFAELGVPPGAPVVVRHMAGR